MYNNLSNYVLHCFCVVLAVVCTTMFLSVEGFFGALALAGTAFGDH